MGSFNAQEHTANRRVSIIRSIKLEGRWHHTRPFISTKSRKEKARVSPDYVWFRREKLLVPMGTPNNWRVFFYQGAKQRWISCESFGDAIDQQRQWEAKLALRAAGGEFPEEKARPTLQTLASEFLEEIKLRELSDDSDALYSVTVNEFVKLAGRTYATDVVHKDVLRYINALLYLNRKSDRKNRPHGPLSKRTANNRVVALKSFFRFCKLDANELVPKRAKPKYDKKKPEAYSADELQTILEAVKTHGSVALAVETAMKCGMRKAEIAHLEWREVDLAKQEIHLHSKEEHGFKIKDDEERVIKIEATLLNKLKDWRKRKLKSRLVFGTKNDKPNNKLLEQMKAAAKKAGVKVNGQLIFHKFRRGES